MARYVIRYSLKDNACFLSHLEIVRFFERFFRKNSVRLAWSEGFNPHPKIRNAQAKSVGVGSVSEYLEFFTVENIDTEILKNDSWVNGSIRIIGIYQENEQSPKINRLVDHMEYVFYDHVFLNDIDISDFRGINSYEEHDDRIILRTIPEFSFSRFSSNLSFSRAERNTVLK